MMELMISRLEQNTDSQTAWVARGLTGQIVCRVAVVADVGSADHSGDGSPGNTLVSHACLTTKPETEVTYKEAKESNTPTRIFVLRAICMFFNKNAGRTAQAKSVRIVDAVEVYDRAIMASMVAHLAFPESTRLLSQLPAIGRHSSKTPTNVVVQVSHVVVRSAYTAKRNHFIVLAMRSIVIQMELLTTARAQM